MTESADAARDEVIGVYRRRARLYDLTANLYYLIGFREWSYRKRAIRALRLQPGASVVEIGCGTGLNFGLLQRAVGPSGRIIGVDLTDAMLAQAERRILREGWTNVELVHADATEYVFPTGVGGILATFALSLVPESALIVEHGCQALAPGGSWVVLDLKLPGWLPAWLEAAVLPLVRPFAVTEEVMKREPWIGIQRAMEVSLTGVSMTELYFGFSYLLSGRKPGLERADPLVRLNLLPEHQEVRA
jgi:demethylmenaquinone methyltransferase/2-methoxy-6-polyprenyl-1,4-benzoquinol methylase